MALVVASQIVVDSSFLVVRRGGGAAAGPGASFDEYVWRVGLMRGRVEYFVLPAHPAVRGINTRFLNVSCYRTYFLYVGHE